MVYGVAAAFGLCIGSFLNVVIYRLPQEGMSIVKPRSACPTCRKAIAWWDNLPVLSYLLLGGRCRGCRTKISLRYPAIELFTALAFLATLVWSQAEEPWVKIVRAGIVAALIAVTMIDFDHFIIPDRITIPGMILAPVISFLLPSLHRQSALIGEGAIHPESALIQSLLGIAAGAGAVWLVGFGGKLIFRKEAMGFGDVKLMGAMGGFLGPEGIVAAFFLGSVLGALFGMGNVLVLGFLRGHRLRGRGWAFGKALSGGLRLGRRLGSYIPFGPFLSAGCAGILFFRTEIFRWALETWPEWVRSFL